MKKVNIAISYDEEKLKALRWYMEQKGISVEDELSKSVDTLFAKNVPASVRSYITREPEGSAEGDAPRSHRKNSAQERQDTGPIVEE